MNIWEVPILTRRGLSTDRTSFLPYEGELLITTDEHEMFVGDGSTYGGVPVITDSTYKYLSVLLDTNIDSETLLTDYFIKYNSSEQKWVNDIIEVEDLPSGIDPLLISSGLVDASEFDYLNGVNDYIQDQLDNKADITGTESNKFQLFKSQVSDSTGICDTTCGGIILKSCWDDLLEIRNCDDTDYADIRAANLVLDGSTTVIDVEHIYTPDNFIYLNTDTTGTPYENAGIIVVRGDEDDVSLFWDEALDIWKIDNYAIVDTHTSQLLYNKTLVNAVLTTPLINDFSNAIHNHTDNSEGGMLTDAALSSPVSISKGGTGKSNRNDAINALLPSQAGKSGSYLITNGTNASWDNNVLTTAILSINGETSEHQTLLDYEYLTWISSGGSHWATWTGTLISSDGGTGYSTYSSGQLLIGKSDGSLNKSTLTAGDNISIINSNGHITISASENGYQTIKNNVGDTFTDDTVKFDSSIFTITAHTDYTRIQVNDELESLIGISGLGLVVRDSVTSYKTNYIQGQTNYIEVINPTGVLSGPVSLSIGDNVVDLDSVQTIENKTFNNCTFSTFPVHDHTIGSEGGQLTDAAFSSVIRPYIGGTGANSSGWTGYAYISSGTWSATSEWVGNTISINKGGTGNTSFLDKSILFSNGSIITENNSKFIWDNNNYRLGVNIGLPTSTLHVDGDIALEYGVNINEISDDETLSDMSDEAIVTERALKSYIDNVAGVSQFLLLTDTINTFNDKRILFTTSSSVTDSSDFIWENTNNLLGIGVSSPNAHIHIESGNVTYPSIIINNGIRTTTPIIGALEFEDDRLYFTPNDSSRRSLCYMEGTYENSFIIDITNNGPNIKNNINILELWNHTFTENYDLLLKNLYLDNIVLPFNIRSFYDSTSYINIDFSVDTFIFDLNYNDIKFINGNVYIDEYLYVNENIYIDGNPVGVRELTPIDGGVFYWDSTLELMKTHSDFIFDEDVSKLSIEKALVNNEFWMPSDTTDSPYKIRYNYVSNCFEVWIP